LTKVNQISHEHKVPEPVPKMDNQEQRDQAGEAKFVRVLIREATKPKPATKIPLSRDALRTMSLDPYKRRHALVCRFDNNDQIASAG
jgi:hypothetical protein